MMHRLPPVLTLLVLALLVLTLLGLAGCASSDIGARNASGTCPLIRLADMPVETHGSMLFVRAKILGSPVMLLVDTGAERTLLTEATVDRLHLPRDFQRSTRTHGIGSATAAWDAKLPDGLTLGDTRFPLDSVTVGRFDMMRIAGEPADGLLGADLLLAFDMDLDLPNDRLTLYRARRACPEAGPPWTEPYVGLVGITTRRDRLQVPFLLDGVEGVAVLDTGAQLSSISLQMAQRLGVSEEQLAADRTVMAHGAAPERVPVRLHRFRELRVGPAVVLAPTIPVVPMASGMSDGLVGADFLHGRRAWLSFSTQRVFVTSIAPGPAVATAQ